MYDDKHKSNNLDVVGHFLELQKRLRHCAIYYLVAFAISYYYSEYIVQAMVSYILAIDKNAIITYTTLYGPFFMYMKISFFTAMALTSPYLMMQVYLFLAPGLYKAEKIAMTSVFVSCIIMFLFGVFILGMILPRALDFFMSYQNSNVMQLKLYLNIEMYADMILRLILAFGLALQFPVILILLARIGIISYEDIVRFRRFAVVIIFIIAAIVTPPDIMSQIALGSIMVTIYEITALICKMVSKKS